MELASQSPTQCRALAPGSAGRRMLKQRAVAENRTSLIPETLREMQDEGHQGLLDQRAAKRQAAEERKARRRSLESCELPDFNQRLQEGNVPDLLRGQARVLQLNVGLYCNQACSHCHVDSSPLRTEAMDRSTAARCLQLAEAACADGLQTLDLTGGAPELNGQFRHLVDGARALGLEVIDRCNLTVLLEPEQEDLVDFLASRQVRIVASLPCYTGENVDDQRGSGVFRRSILALQLLNAAGYGQPGSHLQLDLVYNPNGTFLAPPQAQLQEAYKAELASAYGIHFNSLLALNNMPIKRYADYLIRQGELHNYMQLLVNAFNPAAAEGVMCRDTVSVGWDGAVYDCDFNQQLGLPLRVPTAGRPTVHDVSSLKELEGAKVVTDAHCYGCTAGCGSSCQGSPAVD